MLNFEILQLIGEGSFSKVFKAKRRQDGKIYALKKMKLSELSKTQQKNCLNQVRMLSKIIHPNIIQYKDAFIDQKNLVLVMELAEKGDFLNFMIRRRKARQSFSEEQICVYARQMANGLAALHKTKIIHRDVKAANFYITKEGRVKLGDMNVSAISKTKMAQTKIGTPFYNSPQLWLQKPYSTSADIWSFGCLLYQMVTFCRPFTGKDIYQLKENILKGTYDPLPLNCSEQLKAIIEGCLLLNPCSRLSAKDIIDNPFIKKRYNQFRQQTIAKDPRTLRTHTINCARILREISLGDTYAHTLNLPSSNYSDKKTKKNDKSVSRNNKKLWGSDEKKVKPFSERLLTMMQIYNTKRSTKTSRGATLPRTRLVR